MLTNLKQSGTTIFLTTHYMEEAEMLADQVAFIIDGKIVVVHQQRRRDDAVRDIILETRHEGLRSDEYCSSSLNRPRV